MKKILAAIIAMTISFTAIFSATAMASHNGTYMIVTETFDSGLELRTGPGTNYPTYGPIPVNGIVLAESVKSGWANVSYAGNRGWANTAYLMETAFPVTVYNTGREGLALKAAPDINSQRYMLIPENTQLAIKKVSNGWGYTSYNGTSGWVALRYTRGVVGTLCNMVAAAPTNGWIEARLYRVVNAPEGLELRFDTTAESTSWGRVKNGSLVTIYAIENNWGFTKCDNFYGWLLMTYLE